MQTKTVFVLPLLVFFLAGLEQAQAQTAALDTTTFLVMGEGLAAGMANFGLSSVVQNQSFPARIARQMGSHVLKWRSVFTLSAAVSDKEY